MSASREIVDYVATSTGLCLECSGDLAPGFLIIQIVMLLIGAGIAIFDTYTDWELVLQFRERGFNHPLLPIDVHWLRAWYLFAIIGTVFTVITITHESLDVLHSMWLICRQCCCKSKGRYETNNGKVQENGCNDFEMSERGTNHCYVSEKKTEKREEVKDDKSVPNDACRCCYRCGWNFTTRAETLASITLWFQDVPMLTLAVLYAFSQSTCKLPERRDVSGDLFNVGLSAIASTLAVAYRLARSAMRFFTSIAVRIKSKKETSKMGKKGKCCSRFLPERGDAIYPQDTCAQCCIIPYYISLIFDSVLVVMGGIISLAIWVNYLSLRRAPNFDDSLAIFRFTADENHVHLLNISNIIPSNGSHIKFETISDPDTGDVVYCLSEFQYREEDFDIFFNTIEVQVVSDEGKFCALKSGRLVINYSTYSRCTLYYTLGGDTLFYGSTNRLTGEITRFDDECIVLKDRLPLVRAGPDLDLNIQVENNINRVHLPSADKELLILYVDPTNNNTIAYVPVADIITAGLDKTYSYTLPIQDSLTGSNTTFLIRFQYDYDEAQFMYNVMRVRNYPQLQVCTCTSFWLHFRQIGELVYGYHDAQAGFQQLSECSEIPPIKLKPQYNFGLTVDCSSRCAV